MCMLVKEDQWKKEGKKVLDLHILGIFTCDYLHL